MTSTSALRPRISSGTRTPTPTPAGEPSSNAITAESSASRRSSRMQRPSARTRRCGHPCGWATAPTAPELLARAGRASAELPDRLRGAQAHVTPRETSRRADHGGSSTAASSTTSPSTPSSIGSWSRPRPCRSKRIVLYVVPYVTEVNAKADLRTDAGSGPRNALGCAEPSTRPAQAARARADRAPVLRSAARDGDENGASKAADADRDRQGGRRPFRQLPTDPFQRREGGVRSVGVGRLRARRRRPRTEPGPGSSRCSPRR